MTREIKKPKPALDLTYLLVFSVLSFLIVYVEAIFDPCMFIISLSFYSVVFYFFLLCMTNAQRTKETVCLTFNTTDKQAPLSRCRLSVLGLWPGNMLGGIVDELDIASNIFISNQNITDQIILVQINLESLSVNFPILMGFHVMIDSNWLPA